MRFNKVLFLTVLFLVPALNSFAATRTIAAAGGNWNTAATWEEGVVPTSADDVVARGDGTSGNLTIDVSAACKTIILTNYTGTLTINASRQLAVSGNLTFVSGMTFTDNSTAGVVITTTATINSGGKTFGALTFQGNTTLASDITTTGTLTTGSGTFSGAYNFYAQGDVVVNNFASCTPTIHFTGSANQTWGGPAGQNYNFSTVVNKSGGTFTVSAHTKYIGFINSPTITYTAGTVSTTGSTLAIRGSGTTTLNTNGITWDAVTFGAFESPTISLSSLLTASGSITVSQNTTLSGSGGVSASSLTINASKTLSAGSNTITLTGNFTNNGTFTAGTSTVVFGGSASHTIDGNTSFYSLTCGTGETCIFDDADTFSTNASGVMAGDGHWKSDSAGVQADLNINGTETVTSGNCTDLANAGTSVTSSGTISNCTGWSAPSTRGRMILMS